MKEYSWPLMKNTIRFKEKFNLIKHILISDQFTQGDKVGEFEQEWSKWLGAKYSLFVSSGSTANFLLVAAIKEKYGLQNGDKVLVPTCTWVTNVNPIIQLGLKPIFCDINLEDFSFDLKHMKKVKLEHPDIKLIFVTHLLGIPAKNYEYKKIFPKALIIDDVCESHGSRFDDNLNEKVGSNSLGATFSFYFGHHMCTIEGGMISTNNEELYDLMKVKRSHGLARFSKNFDEYVEKNKDIEKMFLFVSDGYNFRNTELGAILGLTQLKKLDSFIEKRRNNYNIFFSIMANNENFYPISYSRGNSSFVFPMIAKDKNIKESLLQNLAEAGIEFRPIVAGNLLRQPYLQNITNNTYPNSDILHQNGIYIGNNQYLSEKDFDKLKAILNKI